jgi:hypothetical protein
MVKNFVAINNIAIMANANARATGVRVTSTVTHSFCAVQRL